MFEFGLVEGVSAGLLIPKTNAKLLNMPRHDEFHLAGWGLGALLGGNISIYEHFFIQSEFKVGYMNMPDIEINQVESDKAKQDFFYSQLNVVFGFNVSLNKKENTN